MNYYISDLHLFHKNVTGKGKNFDGRPFSDLESMHAYIMERWNNKVSADDLVHILGDVAMRHPMMKLIPYMGYAPRTLTEIMDSSENRRMGF